MNYPKAVCTKEESYRSYKDILDRYAINKLPFNEKDIIYGDVYEIKRDIAGTTILLKIDHVSPNLYSYVSINVPEEKIALVNVLYPGASVKLSIKIRQKIQNFLGWEWTFDDVLKLSKTSIFGFAHCEKCGRYSSIPTYTSDGKGRLMGWCPHCGENENPTAVLVYSKN